MNRALVAVALVSCGGKSTAIETIAAKRAPIVITVGAPGFDAAEVESGVASVIESAVADVPGIEHIRSESRDGRARIAIELAASADPAAASAAVEDRIAGVQRTLPPAIDAPVMCIGWRADAAVVRYTLAGPFAMAALREAAAATIAEPVAAVSGVAGLDICGGSDPALMIYADPAKLANSGVTVTELATALRASHAMSILDLSGLRDIVVAKRGGAVVRLSDVALVSDQGPPPRCHTLDEHSDAAIEGVVYAQGGIDPRTVRAAALAAIEKVGATLPSGMVLEVMPEDKPAALLGLTAPDVAPAARLDQLRRVRDALLAAGAQHVVLAEGVRDPRTGLAENAVEIRVWPASVEQAALARLADVPGLVVARADAKIIAIRGPELTKLHDMAGALAGRLEAAGVATLGRVGDGGVARLELHIDRAAAADLGVPVQAISDTFGAAIDGIDLGQILIAGNRRPIMLIVGAPTDDGGDPVQRLRSLMVRGMDVPDAMRGAAVPLNQLAGVSRALAPATIYHVDRQRWVGVRMAGDGGDAARKVIAAFAAPPGYRVEIE